MKIKVLIIVVISFLSIAISSCKKEIVYTYTDPLADTRWVSTYIDKKNPNNTHYVILAFFRNGEYSIHYLNGPEKDASYMYQTGRYKFVGDKDKFKTYVIFIPDDILNPNEEVEASYNDGTIKYGIYTFYPQ